MITVPRHRWTITLGIALLLIGIAGALFLDGDRGVRAGVGPYAADMVRCRERIFQDLRYPEFIEYVEDTVWHTQGEGTFTLGGVLRVRGAGVGAPAVHSYECESENGRFSRVEVR
ncbi:MAG: hypothetical protein FJX64_10710 [Alphaproteobacteria bacterium]|nr:hypothetical protein [Alphaproteobacteria bacterium]